MQLLCDGEVYEVELRVMQNVMNECVRCKMDWMCVGGTEENLYLCVLGSHD